MLQNLEVFTAARLVKQAGGSSDRHAKPETSSTVSNIQLWLELLQLSWETNFLTADPNGTNAVVRAV